MAKRPRKKTLADYVVIAISPVLIMTLVGSLAFFLLELTYHGPYDARLKWILFWFILASVLVARIAIEQGKEYASLFGVALIAVVGLATIRLVDQFLLAWVLLAVSWWCTWKLTWDCTLIDDRQDASGEGLLQAAGLDAAAPGNGQEEGPNRQVHPPGKWVVYFSLAALPLFGAGQLMIPSRDVEGREYGFRLLALYVASALGLLLTTSFLGLRRYLRQRKLQMPTAMAGTWLAMGTAFIVALLCLALLLPQPQGEYTLTALVDKLDAKIGAASRFAVVPGDRAKGAGRRVGQQDPKEAQPGDGRPPNQKPEARNAPGQQKQPGGQPNQRDRQENKDEQKADPKSEDQGQKKEEENQADRGGNEKQAEPGTGGRAGRTGKNQDQAAAKGRPGQQRQAAAQPPKETQRQANASPPPPASSGSAISGLLQGLASLFKWLIYGTLAIVAAVLAIRYWPQIREALAKFWAELLNALGKRREVAGQAPAQAVPTAPLELRFSAFDNPFFSGAAGRMSPAQLVRYTFEALEAWAREHVAARPAEQTPLEFARELGRRNPAMAEDLASTAELYARVAYARKNPPREAVAVLERLWRRMGMEAGT